MIEVVEAVLGLVGDLTDDVRIGEMTFDAGPLLVVGNLPSAADVVDKEGTGRPIFWAFCLRNMNPAALLHNMHIV